MMNRRGFSLMEVMVTVASAGVLASIVFITTSNVIENSKDRRLTSDIETVNRAVKVYLANGGSLDDVESPEAVLKKLKSTASNAARTPGLSSSMIDPRIGLEASEDGTGVIWDPIAQQFVLGSGDDAFAGFFYDESLAEVTPDTEERASTFQYAESSNWIWDFQETANPTISNGPTLIDLTSQAASPVLAVGAASTPSTAPTTPSPSTPAGILSAPTFSVPGGTYGIANYDLLVSLINPNPGGVSRIVYSVDFGPWDDYTGPITVAPGSTLSAQTVPTISDWDASGKVDQYYAVSPQNLNPPLIVPDLDGFGLFSNQIINVTLINTNTEASSISYRVNGGAWTDYANTPFPLNRADYPGGVDVEARVVSAAPYYLDSQVTSRSFSSDPLALSGMSTGSFHTPVGSSGLVTNLAPGGSDDLFEWGDDDFSGGSQSWLDFNGAAFSSVNDGERFQLGSLDYYNGTILSGTGADSIDFTIDLTLDINGNIFNPFFDFEFELINTANSNDPNNPWPDADFVRIDDTRASRTLVVNDTEFEFRLEFGDTTPDGFASFDEFHVLEERDASVGVYGTFIEIGKVTPSGPGTTSSQNENYTDPVENAKVAYDDVQPYTSQAESALADVNASAASAKTASNYTKHLLNENRYDDAVLQANKAQAAADQASIDLLVAQDASIQAKTIAAEASGYALQDASADYYSELTIQAAIDAVNAFNLAQTAASQAASDAASAASAISGYSPPSTGGGDDDDDDDD
ncbi:MAG: choice-of-anchor K domain-containing protein [Verrucomicrobiota bacterium]